MPNKVKPSLSNLLAVTICTFVAMAFSGSAVRAGFPAGNAASEKSIQVPAGTTLVVRMIDSVSSKTNKVGDTFTASLEQPLVVSGTTIAPKSTKVHGKLQKVKSAGKIKGKSELRLTLTGIDINGTTRSLVTGEYGVQGKLRGSETAKKVGIGVAVGGAIGAIAGGGKGAAIGAGVGAGAGTAVQVLTQGQQINVPSETVLNFTIAQPVTLPVASS